MDLGTRSEQDARERFRALRHDAFAARGFHGEGSSVRDSAGYGTFLLDNGQPLDGGDGPSLLLLHGGVGVTAEWAPIAEMLPGRVLIPDRPGFGLSEARSIPRDGFRADAAAWLAGLLDALGLDRVDLIGASMGGFVAISFATAHPERVRRLVLTGAAGGLLARPGLFLQLWGAPAIGAVISRMMPRDVESVRRRALAGYLSHPERVPDELLRVALAAMRLPGWARANRDILREVTTLRGWRPEARLDGDLVRSGIPTRFIVGDGDTLTSPAAVRSLSERMPDAAVDVVEDAGHIPHLDRPAAVADAIRRAIA